MSQDLLEQMAAELRALEEAHPTVALTMPLQDAWVLIGVLQLVLRHPGLGESSRRVAERIKSGLVSSIATTPALALVARMGDDPQFDS